MGENGEVASLAGRGDFGMQIVSTSIAYPNSADLATFSVLDMQAARVSSHIRVTPPVARLIAGFLFDAGRRRT